MIRFSFPVQQALWVVLLLSLALAPAAQAQSEDEPAAASVTNGLFLNAHIGGSGIALGEQDRRDGGGFGGRLGYGLFSRLAVFAGLDADGYANDDALPGTDNSDDFGVAHLDVGAQYLFAGAQRAFVPYLSAAYTVRTLIAQSDDDLTLSGRGVTAGAGIRYYVAPKAAIEIAGGFTVGDFTDLDRGDDGTADEEVEIRAQSFRLGIGLTFYPFQ